MYVVNRQSHFGEILYEEPLHNVVRPFYIFSLLYIRQCISQTFQQILLKLDSVHYYAV
jgi:hypothetical protein